MQRILIGGLVTWTLGLGAQEGSRAIALRPGPTQTALQESRVALVIGNGAYDHSPLKNPANDASAIAAALRACGFKVDLVLNADRARMFKVVRDFGQKIAGGGVGLFYFAGHGMAVNGTNYLIPVGTDIATEDEVEVQALSVQAVLGKMEAANNRLNILVLDACRNNPFKRKARSGGAGLAQMEAPKGSFVAYATAPGSTASDGGGVNGLYTEQFLAVVKEPGLSVEQVFKKVRVGVMKASQDRQIPWESSSLTGDFAFLPSQGGAPQAAAEPARPAPAAMPVPTAMSETAPRLEDQPAGADAQYRAAVAQVNMGDIQGAKTSLRQAITIDASFPDSYYLMGVVEINLDNLKAARQAFRTYLDLRPSGGKAGEVRALLKELGQ